MTTAIAMMTDKSSARAGAAFAANRSKGIRVSKPTAGARLMVSKGLGGHACLCSPGVVPLSILPDALGGLRRASALSLPRHSSVKISPVRVAARVRQSVGPMPYSGLFAGGG